MAPVTRRAARKAFTPSISTPPVLEIPEVLEMILLQIDMRTLLISCQRVCRDWRDLITKSLSIQKPLFFTPIKESEWGMGEKLPNLLLAEMFPAIFPAEGEPRKRDFLFSDCVMTKDPASLDRFVQKDASWRRMLVQQPPILELGLFHIDSARGGDSALCVIIPVIIAIYPKLDLPANTKSENMRLSQPDPAELKNGKDNANQGTLIKPRKTEDRDFLQSPSPSILSGPEKVLSIIIVTTMTFLGPAPMSIYFPILGSLSRDLQVSPSEMSLTITVFSDQLGRRPVFIVRLTASLGANLGLAWQTSFTALMALRCLQSFGSSSLSVVSIATMTDIITRAGRAKYRIYTSSGYTLASLLGSVTGGLLAQFIGWQSVFWFLAIYAGVMLFITLVFLRESCRAVLYPLEYCQVSTPQPPSTLGQGVLDTIRLLGSWQTGLLVAFQAVLFCGTMAIFANIPLLFERQYGFQAWQVGLVYVPYAAGGFAARWIVSPLTARNVRRYRCLVGAESMDHRPQDFPFERACLEVILPLVYLACAWKNIIAFGHPVSGTTVKLSQGDHGELLIKSPAVFSHYLNDLAATKAAFTDDGFYRTGDLVSREDTKYFFHGRASTDFIKYYGYRIPISALEQKLNELPGVREGYILAMPDVNCGYRAAALIRLTQDADADLQTATFARTIGWTQPGGGTGVHGATVGMSG
ncbi:hypothetical protein PENANT_c001G09794 [Penicillium antarcticum]|uniref:Uncharacterized protein n=1 Tax=Penicillium antarcticum TaxID=416450 RepID=A0A1V6QMR0_9EURO|nr:hypothetical protein PENANT_c001G09794 [Penicillium antarcticum]